MVAYNTLRKVGEEKSDLWLLLSTNQIDHITEIAPYVRTYFWDTI